MSTAFFEVAMDLEVRRREIDLLINEAKKCRENNSTLYNVLCRSCTVFLASHLEGFIKDATRGIVLDFNFYTPSFIEMPAAMQHTFCKQIAYFEGVANPEIDTRIKQLKSFFAVNSVPIDMGAFSYKENVNKNPSNKQIDSAFEKLGVKSVLSSIADSRFEAVFDNDHRTNYLVLRDLRRLRSLLYRFPYKPVPPIYRFNRSKKASETIWHSFVEEVLSRRHQIVHGDTLSNLADVETLQADSIKMYVLMNAILLSAADFFST